MGYVYLIGRVDYNTAASVVFFISTAENRTYSYDTNVIQISRLIEIIFTQSKKFTCKSKGPFTQNKFF